MADGEPVPAGEKIAINSRSRISSVVFIQNRLRRLNTSSSTRTASDVVDSRGPMGLCLLHEPSEPRIDFIFIHGLGGGSRKTWSYSPHPGMFWPRDWLPNEEGFKHVRLHSYGYNSSWTDRKTSRLTIHDFAQSFVADMYNSPHLRRHGDTPIVLVAHSMGGLVAKKAYLLARRDPIYKALADRMHTMYFLGTPHRGAGSAQLAKLLVDLSSNSTKAFLDDLLPGSGTLDAINDEFRNACGGLELWSFFEGAATNFGLTSSLVVNKDSAVMGLPREHIQYLNADHRHICKFRDPTDTNYITLCRSFLTTIEAIETGMSFQHRDEYRSQMKMITSLLDLEHSPAADLFAIADKQQPGSCQWLTDHPTFREWVGDPRTWDTPDLLNQASPSLPPKLLWIHGRPGTGKTVAAGHVIRYLKGSNLDCSFYFFRYNDSSRSTLAGLLRSIAFQMSESSFEFRRCIVNFIKDGDRISKDDHHMLWNKLFLNRIFKCENFKPHFWIIDALDECSSKSASTLIHMVSRLDVNLPLRILITSRPGGQLERSFAQERIGFMGISTGQAESLNDIEAFLRARCPQLRDSGRYENLVAEMLSKSNGNFLWASLTMTALEDVYSVEDMHEALEQIPSEMNEFYSRILNSIVESRSADIAKCILTWVICSPTLLTLSELEAAVKLDIDKTLTASHSQLEAMCGHLISVDNHSLVHVTHLTVSAFLTQENTSFWIDRPAAHSRLAEVCLALLCGKEFSPPKSRRTDSGIKPEPPVLADYACLNFSHHIKHSASAVDPPLVLLDKFLRTNVLTWIERAAKRGDLSILLRTAQRLKAYLGRRARDRSPLGAEVQSVDAWIVDLPHVVAVFGRCLLDSPASIYFLIPPLCPPASVVSKLFAKPTRRLKVFGTLDDAWSDRLTCLIHSVEAVSIASCDRLLAVGLSNGEIHVYDCVTFDAVAVLCHGQSVRNLSFCTGSTFLASCSLRKLRLWHSRHPNNQAPVWESDLDFVTFDLLFSPDNKQLLLPNKNNIIEVFSVETGARQSGIQFLATSDSDSSDGSDQVTAWIPPARIRLDASQKLAALSYRGAAITVWNLEEKEEIGVFEKEGFEGVFSPPALDLVFNPLSDLELLAISYKDGTIATCNPWSLEQVCVQRQFVDILAATSDGRILAGGDALGVIHLFFFETLQPIYRISSLTESVQKIAFSFDNSMLFDVRGRCCNVWEPFVLVFKDGSDESSSEPQSEDVTIREPATDHLRTFVWGNAVTITAQTKDGSFLFAGRQDGVIDVYSLTTGEVVEKLHFHPDLMEIRFLEWVDEKNLLLSVNDGGVCMLSRVLLPPAKDTEKTHQHLMNYRECGILSQVLCSPDGTNVLFHTTSATRLRRTDGSLVCERSCRLQSKWIPHPTNLAWLILVQDDQMSLFTWSDLQQILPSTKICDLLADRALSPEHWGIAAGKGTDHLVHWSRPPGRGDVLLTVLDLSRVTPEETSLPSVAFSVSIPNAKLVLGVFKSSFFFLDTNGWVCSFSLKALPKEKAPFYTRHFFIPPTWRTSKDPVARIVSKSTVAVAREDKVIILHGFLEFEEKVYFREGIAS